MAEKKTLSRIYDLKVIGADTSLEAVKKMTGVITTLDNKIRAMKAELSKKSSIGDADGIKDLTKRISEMEAALKATTNQKIKAAREAELLAKAEKLTADAALKRTQNIIAQDKELERLLKNEAKEEAALKKKRAELDALDGSYKKIRNQLNELRPLIQAANSNSTISFGGQNLNFQQAVDEFKRLSAAEQDFRRQFAKDGTLVGEYTTGIIQAFQQSGLDDLIKGQVERSKQSLQLLNKEFDQLKKEVSEVGVNSKGSLEVLEKQLIDNRTQAQKLEGEIKNLNAGLQGTGGLGTQISTSLKTGLKDAVKELQTFAVTAIGIQAAISKGSQLIGDAKDISDAATEIEINMGKASSSTEKLTDALSKIQTRTSIKGLQEIADVALKAGVSNQNIVEVTAAIDKVKGAFGKDFGSIEQGTETFAKLINIFYEDGEITGERILNVGNSIRTLANESTASVPYLTDFSGRMAGVKQIANVTIPDILGLGAGFEQFKQSAETSSTALVKIIPKLAEDSEKYAAILGVTKEKYSELINADPTRVLIDVAEKLVKNGKGIEEVSSALADSELGSGRITTILSTLGGKADTFRASISRAKETINETGNITEAFDKKQENLAGTLDKVSKKFSDVAASKAFQTTITVIASGVLLLLNNLPLLIGLTALLTTGWLVQNSALVLLNLRLAYYTVMQRGLAIVYGIGTAMQAAYTISLGVLTGAYNLATGAAMMFSRVLLATPLGVILAIVGLLAASFSALAATVDGSTSALRRKAIQDQINADINKRVVEQTADQIAKISTLTAVIRDNNASKDVQRKALEELKAAGGKYLEGLTLQNIATEEGTRLIDKYVESLKQKAAYEAASAIQAEKIKEDLKLSLIENKLQQRVSTGNNTDLGDLTEEEKAFVGDARKQFAFTASVSDLVTGGSAADEALVFIKEKRSQLSTEIDATTELIKSKYSKLNETVASGNTGVGGNAIVVTGSVFERFKQLVAKGGKEEDFKKLRDDISSQKAGLNILSNNYKDLKKLESQIDDFLNPKSKSFNGSRLTGGQKDDFKDIEARRDQLLAIEEKKFSKLQITEEQYLRNILKINTDAASEKLKLINDSNAEERKKKAELDLYIVKQQTETSQKIFAIKSKELETAVSIANAKAEAEYNAIQDNPASTEMDKLKAREDLLKKQYALQFASNTQMEVMELMYGQKSSENERKRSDALLKILREFNKTKQEIVKESYEMQLRKIDQAEKLNNNSTESQTASKTISILGDNSLSNLDKSRKLKELELTQSREFMNREVEMNRKRLDTLIAMELEGLATKEQVSDAYKALKLSELALAKSTSDQEQGIISSLTAGLKNAWSNVTGFFKGVKATQEEINGTVARAKDIITNVIGQAKDAYFQGQTQKVEVEKQAALDRIDIEQKQLEAVAQSESEKESIRKSSDLKRKDAERKAAEEKKAIALKQATIDYGLAVIKTLAAYPFPFSLLPVAALSLQYALQRQAIQSQKFATGGIVQPLSAGRISATPNIPTQTNGDNVLATVRVGEVILNEAQQRMLGGARTFARLGVPGFATGGLISRNDIPGSSLRPPVFTTFNGSSSEDISKLANIVAGQQNAIISQNLALAEMYDKLMNIKVNVVAKEVFDKHKETVNASSIGTL